MKHMIHAASRRRGEAALIAQSLQQSVVNNTSPFVQAVRVANMLGQASTELVVCGAAIHGTSDDGASLGAAVGAVLNLVMS